MKKLNFWLAFLTVVVLGISAGAMLGEQQTLVPFWKEMQPNDFYAWYAENAAQLKGFFAPWQIAGVVLAVITAVVAQINRHPGTAWFGVSSIFAVGVLATFFLFFKDANASFAAQAIPSNEVSAALSEWSSWQWGRISLGAAAFFAALYGLSKRP